MTSSEFEIVVVGGGAAGIAAARKLHDAGLKYVLLEARSRLGGRAWTISARDMPLDLGCGWLHSADRNPWSAIALHQGLQLDKTPPPWTRPSLPIAFSVEEQKEFRFAIEKFHERLDDCVAQGADAPASQCLLPGERWNALIGAVATFITGAELDRVSAVDLHRSHDSNINWRVVEGYGSVVIRHAVGLNIVLECAARRIDHNDRRLRIETNKGEFAADAVIITIPSALLAKEVIAFSPALPQKLAAAADLPLGLDDKLFLSLNGAEEFEKNGRLFGRTDRVDTGAYHVRPFGRPMIEAYFGGSLAESLERGGSAAFFEFAKSELSSLLGSDFERRIAPTAVHAWGADPFAGGAYSYARLGRADSRAELATSVDDRLFFAGEACSPHDFSTAHGAYLTGIAAAENVIELRSRITR